MRGDVMECYEFIGEKKSHEKESPMKSETKSCQEELKSCKIVGRGHEWWCKSCKAEATLWCMKCDHLIVPARILMTVTGRITRATPKDGQERRDKG